MEHVTDGELRRFLDFQVFCLLTVAVLIAIEHSFFHQAAISDWPYFGAMGAIGCDALCHLMFRQLNRPKLFWLAGLHFTASIGVFIFFTHFC